jgi:hypothetical protein
LCRSKNTITGLIFRSLASWKLGRSLQDNTGKFGTGNPWQRRLMLVLATDLKQVEEIGCRCVDGNEILIRLWNGIR